MDELESVVGEQENTGTEIGESGQAPESASPEVEASGGDAAPEASGEQTPPAYQPNYKFRVRGLDDEDEEDGDEMEFDEFLRGAVTTKEAEDKLRDLYTRAYGLDAIKPRHQKLQERFSTVAQHYNKLDSTVREILRLRDEGDYGAFLEKVGIQTPKLAEWLVDQIRTQQLPPEERSRYEEAERLRRENRQLRDGGQSREEAALAQATQLYEEELHDELRDPEVRQLVRDYDKQVGERGAFEEFVLDYGSRYYRKHGKNIRPAKAVRECLKLLRLESQAPSQGAQPSGAAQTKVITPSKVAVIPNTGASASGTPVKRPKTFADLKKLAKGQEL